MITPEEKTNDFLSELEEANKKLEEEKIKNEYLSAQINIHTNSHNIGEKDEVLTILRLFYYNKSNQYDKLIEIFGDEACEGISIIDETGCVITNINKINKAKGCLHLCTFKTPNCLSFFILFPEYNKKLIIISY